MTNTIARTLFLVIFVVVCIALIGWEITSLLAVNKGNNTQLAVIKDKRFGEGPLLGYAAVESTSMAGQSAQAQIVSDDARPLLLKRYLEKYNSPLVNYTDLIFSTSKTYNFDYRWIVAIAQQESNLCKKIPDESYNCWGYGIHSKGTLRFDNYELAIKSFGEYLKREYFDKGLTTPEQIMKKYCPPSNGSWANGVSQFFNDIEQG